MTRSAKTSSPSRTVLAAAAAIVVLAAGSFALIAADTRSAPGAPPASAAAPSPPRSPSSATPESPDALASSAAAASQTAVPAAPVPAAPEPPPIPRRPPSPEQVARSSAPAVSRLMPSRARTMISFAIEQQVPKLAPCFGRGDAKAPPGGATRGEALVARRMSRRSKLMGNDGRVLRLDLEPQQGEIWIHDVALEQAGTVTPAELACARRALRGVVLEMPGTTPGPRVAMMYPIP